MPGSIGSNITGKRSIRKIVRISSKMSIANSH